MIILGVDPGSHRTGYGAIETDGRTHRLLECGVIRPPAGLPLHLRLRLIHDQLLARIGRLGPQVLAVEDLFHHKSARSALVLGHVRGAVLLAGAQAGLLVSAFAPATVKLQVTGQGGAEKAQVALMVNHLLRLDGASKPGDAADALAVALCHAHLHGVGPALVPVSARPAGVAGRARAGRTRPAP